MLIILLFHHLEHLESPRERHADRLNSWVGCLVYLNNFPLYLTSLAFGREWNRLEINTGDKQNSCLILAIKCRINCTQNVLQYNKIKYNSITIKKDVIR